ncbi:hypothetical protein RPIT_09435 [Tessaracoccus flavus]|uniref:Uncharacterized protein n=2 Tax=Tessaracoccus flavus TaxID=1610493 RepID=A0A1Q2CFT9_9ACTN|nr:hypothetical protein RPIT_09435 [Tessaracoccus flavus]SDY60267.1 hypothetical protein SAMN05428934_102420 [Tessaracoccus flavus]
MNISTTTALWRARLRYWLAGRRRVTLRLLGRASDSSDAYLRIAQALEEKHESSGMSSEEAMERGLVEALEILTEHGPPQVAAALKADGPRMLAEHRRLDRGFEKRIRQRWGTALDLYYMIAVACQEVGAEGYQEANQCDEGSESERALLEAMSGLQARACRQSLEVLSLLETGFPKAAHAVSRSMHEGAVVASVLTEYGSTPEHADIGTRFLLFDHITNLMDAEEYQRYAERLKHEPFTDQEMAALRTTKAEVLERFPDLDRKMGWAGDLPGLRKRTFEELEVIAGIDHLRPYYTWASHEVHAYPKGVRLNQSGLDGDLWKLAGRTNAGLADPAQGALIALNQVTASMLTVPGVASPSRIVASRATMALLDEAREEFARIERELADERTLTVW